MCTALFTAVRHLSLFRARLNQAVPCLEDIRVSKWPITSRFPQKNSLCISRFKTNTYTTRASDFHSIVTPTTPIFVKQAHNTSIFVKQSFISSIFIKQAHNTSILVKQRYNTSIFVKQSCISSIYIKRAHNISILVKQSYNASIFVKQT